MQRKILIPKDAPPPTTYYSLGLRVGPMLYTSGQTSRDKSGQLVGSDDPTQQAEQAFTNLSRVLGEGEMGYRDIVRINLFIRTITELKAILAVMERFLEGNRPSLSIVIVENLANPAYRLEVEAVAWKEEN